MVAGPQNLSMTRALTPSVVIGSESVNYVEGERYTYFLFGNNQEIGLHAQLLLNDPGEFESNQGKVRIIDGMIGAADVKFNGAISGVVPFGNASAYLSVNSGPATVAFTRQADGARLGSANLLVEAGKLYSIVLAGEVDYFVSIQAVED